MWPHGCTDLGRDFKNEIKLTGGHAWLVYLGGMLDIEYIYMELGVEVSQSASSRVTYKQIPSHMLPRVLVPRCTYRR